MLVVDDRLLLTVLSGRMTGGLRSALDEGELFTTGGWYYRLSHAIHRSEVAGKLSGAFASLEAQERTTAVRGLNELPGQIGLLSLRKLVPIMSLLDVGQPLNLLSAEALAACVVLGAGLVVTTDSPMLRIGADRLHVPYDVTAV